MENKGLLEYEATGEITKNFLEDFNFVCKKIYSRWKLNLSVEDFISCCTEKMLLRISAFDSTRSNIGNYIFNLVLNEARRIHSLDLHLVDTAAEEFLLYKASPADDLIYDIWRFALYAYSLGIYVNQEQLLADYQRGLDKPWVTVFAWMRSCGRLNVDIKG